MTKLRYTHVLLCIEDLWFFARHTIKKEKAEKSMDERWQKLKEKIKKTLIAVRRMGKRTRRRLYVTIVAAIPIFFLVYYHWPQGQDYANAPSVLFTEFLTKVKANEITKVNISGEIVLGFSADGTLVRTRVDVRYINLVTDELAKRNIPYGFDESPVSPDVQSQGTYTPLFVLGILALWALIFFKVIDLRGNINWYFWKSRMSRLTSSADAKITFKDVAGIDEVKAEVQQIVTFLKDPEKFHQLGARMPRGVLLIGPPGTGKTLLAQAIAGEADVPFHSSAGSDFVELFVGQGASRVRSLFDEAMQHSPCIIYIDEIDSVGAQRTLIRSGGDAEYNQTTNALLSAMGGFDPHLGIVVMASTNNPANLDAALLRPGRFDRKIVVPLPDARGREEILKVHTRKLPLAEDVNLKELALGTPGFSGADLANLANEAALAATERGTDKQVKACDFRKAKDKVMMGEERKSLRITEQDKWRTAHHEVGHAFVALRTPGTDPIEKISVMPRGIALGVTIQLPTQDRYHYTKEFLEGRLAVMMGGRAAEDIFFNGDVSAGAQSDIDEATKIASNMVCQWGLSSLGPIILKRGASGIFSGHSDAGVYDCSGGFATRADEEISKILLKALDNAKEIILKERDTVMRVTQELVRRTDLTGHEMKQIVEKGSLE